MNDVNIGHEDDEGLLKDVEKVLVCNIKVRMKPKLTICRFRARKEQNMGHEVSPQGLHASKGHLESIMVFREPTKMK